MNKKIGYEYFIAYFREFASSLYGALDEWMLKRLKFMKMIITLEIVVTSFK